MPSFDYDLFVIGAGSGGVRACRTAASLGAKVAVAEERYFGGTCVNVGCVPKKLFSYAAHYRDDLEDSRGFGWDIPEMSFNWATLIKNKNNEINRLNGIYKAILDNNDVSVFTTRARIVDPHTVAVAGKNLSAKYILIATGGWPWVPDYEGSEHVITSNEVFTMESLPSRMLVVGGGYISVEFASIFTRLGCETTLSYRGDQLLRGFDEEIRHFITAEIGRHVDLRLETDINKIVKNNKGLRVYFKSGDELDVDTVLSATGRKPLSDDLGLENVEIELAANGAIVVDEKFQTGVSSIYAVGDVIGKPALASTSMEQGRLAALHAFGAKTHHFPTFYPIGIYTIPEISSCGYTEEQLINLGFHYEVGRAYYYEIAKNVIAGNDQGMFKILFHADTLEILGIHIIGRNATEVIHIGQVAMTFNARIDYFIDQVFNYPTYAEGYRIAALNGFNKVKQKR